MSEASNEMSEKQINGIGEVCVTCVAIGVVAVAVISLAVLIWTQFI